MSTGRRLRSGRDLATVAAAAAVVGSSLAYAASHRSRLATWGSTDAEVAATMPGDELIGTPRYRSTHAVSIGVPAAEVWPWLVQLGQGRGGFYSYDRVENLVGLQIHSASRIEPALQRLAVGDVVRLVPDGTEPPLRFAVARLEAPYVLVLGPTGTRAEAFAERLPHPCWTFQLRPVADGGCRLVVRLQLDFAPTRLARLAYGWAMGPVHLVMERRMMLGIRQRAECSDDLAPHLSVQPA